MNPEDLALIILASLSLTAAIAVPLLLYMRLLKRVKHETSQLTSALDRNLGAVVKLLEVRTYYDETSAVYKKMLQDAYKEGNRHRQDELRKLTERLETLKVRALDKQLDILKGDGTSAPSKRRRRPRRRGGSRGQGNKPQNQGGDKSRGRNSNRSARNSDKDKGKSEGGS